MRKNKLLNEEQVLQKLEIDSFENLPENKVKKFSKLLMKMDPEVAKTALMQVPEFAKTTKEVIVAFKEVALKGFQIASDSTKSFNESCDIMITALSRQLEDGNLSYEQKLEITTKVMELLAMKDKRAKEDKEFILSMVKSVGEVALKVAAVVGVVLVAIGSATSNDNSQSE